MKLAIFGATGGTGKEVVKQALEKGHSLKLLVRSPEKLTEFKDNSNVELIQGNVRELSDVEKTVNGTDAVVNCLGNTYGDKSQPGDICSVGTRNILAAMKQYNVDRSVTVSSMGVSESWYDMPLFIRPILWIFLGKALADKEIQEKDIRDSGTNWTIVRPPRLTSGPKTTTYKVAQGWSPREASRADVADFCLKALESNEWDRKAVAIGQA